MRNDTGRTHNLSKDLNLDNDDLENLQPRPPVVMIMGHENHGKTSLLDAIRHTKVAQGEAGGITQYIGAYHVDLESNGKIQQVVFLDTPGYEAFTPMQLQGAPIPDIAILVVAADDGVQPQTVEAINHAKAAQVPIIVAINKIDLPEAQPDRVKQELTEYGLVPEEWGGDTIMVPVSAIQRENLDTLLEWILLFIEIYDLNAEVQQGELKELKQLNLILKADAQSSVEAIIAALKQLPQDEVQLWILLAVPGSITESDIDLAAASGVTIVGFNTTLAPGAREAANAEGVDIREYNNIYKLVEDIKGAMEDLLEPEVVEEPLG
jgi:small GTP-binding protein